MQLFTKRGRNGVHVLLSEIVLPKYKHIKALPAPLIAILCWQSVKFYGEHNSSEKNLALTELSLKEMQSNSLTQY